METKVTIKVTAEMNSDDVVITGAMPVRMFALPAGSTYGCLVLHLSHCCSDIAF
jgi:hypothetical protein